MLANPQSCGSSVPGTEWHGGWCHPVLTAPLKRGGFPASELRLETSVSSSVVLASLREASYTNCGEIRKTENPKNCQKKIYFQLKHQLWPTCRRTSIAVSYAALITLVATWPWINGQIKHFHCLLVLLQIHGLCGHLYLSVAVNSRTPSQPRCAPPPQTWRTDCTAQIGPFSCMKTELLACRHAKGSDLKCWSFRNQASLTIKKLRLVMLFDHKCRIVDKLWSYLSSRVYSIDAGTPKWKNIGTITWCSSYACDGFRNVSRVRPDRRWEPQHRLALWLVELVALKAWAATGSPHSVRMSLVARQGSHPPPLLSTGDSSTMLEQLLQLPSQRKNVSRMIKASVKAKNNTYTIVILIYH